MSLRQFGGTETVIDREYATAWGRPAGERDQRDRLMLMWERAAARQEQRMLDYLGTNIWTPTAARSRPSIVGPLGEEQT